MKKYKTYKESGLQHIGKIPKEWIVTSLNHLSHYVKTGSTPPTVNNAYFENGKIPWFGPSDFNSLILTDAKKQVTQKAVEDGKCRLFDENAILVIGIGATVGKVGIAKTICSANQQINAISFDESKMNPLFALYFLSSIKNIIISEADSSTLPIFNQTQTKELRLVKPSLKEQTQIANYLDHKTQIIDTLITKKEQLLKKLQAQRQAIINEAVTKGLNKNAKLKDSGIEWLGEIPQHWEVVKIGHYVNIFRGASPRPAGDPKLFKGDFMPWITVSEVANGNSKFLTETKYFLTELGSKQSRIVTPETLLLSNSGATLGVPKITLIEGCINDGSVAFDSFNEKLERDFLYHFFITHTKTYREEMAGYGQPNLNTEIIKSTKIPLPPIEEQLKIIAFIEKTQDNLSEILKTSKLSIQKLKTYRQSIISEAVTGKIDVRNWQAKPKVNV